MSGGLPRLDHVQLAMPAGAEDRLRPFYGPGLDLVEVAKPPVLAARGGLWYRRGELELHLGVDEDFRPARKAHPAIVVADLDAVVARLQAQSRTVRFDEDLPGVRRCHVSDPVGNRIELIAGG
ncbi:MAG TPA: glyoxalase [Candidatus Dormibacteraeota bacterium]|nr:glyoxalase [Candidatus Dormibacteraeota bacterium]